MGAWTPVVSCVFPKVRYQDLENVGFRFLRADTESLSPADVIDGAYLLLDNVTYRKGDWVFLSQEVQRVPGIWDVVKISAPPVLVLQAHGQKGWETIGSSWVIESPWDLCLTKRRLEIWMVPRVYVHGTLVEVFGIGVLLVGPSGVGKTECALDLLHRGHFFIADDLVELVYLREETRGRSGSREAHLKTLAEIRGLGFIDVEKLFGLRRIKEETQVDLVVELLHIPSTTLSSDREPFERTTLAFKGRTFPCVRLPVQASKSLGPIVETAVLQFRMEHHR